MSNRIYTIGHSTRELHELVALLKENGVTRLADIRRYPGSRRYPHFSREALAKSLPENGIAYVHFEDLGGRRKPLGDSLNKAWRNEQFRAYADYMATEEFRRAVDRLLDSDQTTAYMCAEAVPWRCHRNLLSDELVRRGLEVVHILGPHSRQEHEMNEHAVVAGDHVTYP
ncbi:MAG TPA: DUF488 domain-containing protein [Thermoanaerobaculia bacterium]|nr:DUF488 domain-containing protein [Thermoanaerobaculia bacterium]